MMTSKTARNALLTISGVAFLTCAGCARKETELEPTPAEEARPAPILRPQPQFRPVKAEGEEVREAHLTTHVLPQMHSRLDIRTVLVAAGKPTTLTMENEAVLEIRAGALSNIARGQSQRMERGEMWHVAKGERVTLQAFGEIAVVRVIYLLPGEK
jgi:hypothetical protein